MKYYTPKIEEFHVNFEYEENTLSGWNTKTMTWNDYPSYAGDYIGEGLQEDRIRVKILDKEDIESLGYEVMSGASMFYKFGKDRDFFEYDFTNHLLRVYTAGFGFIELEIKNKSELKKFLEMYKRWSA